jgi:hypothetical protein
MRVAFVSTPGQGHINTLLSLWKTDESAHLFVLRFNNSPFLNVTSDRITEISTTIDVDTNVARDFNERRASLLTDELHVRIYDFMPTLIVYDFFCLEARTVAYRLGIPAICSIPATLKPDETETCSDGVLPKELMYWIWRRPYPVSIEPVQFLGPRLGTGCLPVIPSSKPVILVTFGTVIEHDEDYHDKLSSIMLDLQKSILVYDMFYQFVILNAHRFRHIPGVTYLDNPDLPSLLQAVKPALLIFHGGGNTYSEALEAGVPVLCCPFFGDQFETARQCGNVYSGDMERDIARSIDTRPIAPQGEISRPFFDMFPCYFKPGDLVFGQKLARRELQKNFPHLDLHLEHFANFDTFAGQDDLPAIADVYNDETRPNAPGEYGRRLAEARAERAMDPSLDLLPPEHRLVHYCIQILRLTVHRWGGKIHFVISDGIATRIELNHILLNWSELCEKVIFYNVSGKRVPAPFDWPKKNRGRCASGQALYNHPVDIPGRVPFCSGRIKSDESIYEKSIIRKLPVHDIEAYRIPYLNQDDLEKLADVLFRESRVIVSTYGGRIVYYYQGNREIQLWPYAYLHYFYLNMNGEETDRNHQRKLQDVIEELK